MKAWLPPPATVADAGVGPLASVAIALLRVGVTGATFVALAPPVLVTVKVSVIAWPVLTVAGVAAMVALSAAEVCTVTTAEAAGVALRGAPELASVPEAVPLSVRLPAADGVQVHVKSVNWPDPMIWGGAGLTAVHVAVAVPLFDGVTAEMLALAVPPFVSLNVRVTAWFTSTVVRLATIVAVRPAGTWTVTGAAWAIGLFTCTFEKLSVPVAEALNVSCPAAVGL